MPQFTLVDAKNPPGGLSVVILQGTEAFQLIVGTHLGLTSELFERETKNQLAHLEKKKRKKCFANNQEASERKRGGGHVST